MRAPRSLVLLVVAVLGLLGGVTAATRVLEERPPSASARPDPDPAPPPRTGEPGEVLWVDQRAVHDGDLEVPVQLVDPPLGVVRVEGGWVVETTAPPFAEDPLTVPEVDALLVRPDATTLPLAQTLGTGVVSQDGTQWVAATRDGRSYGVWDLETGEQVETLGAVRPGDSASGWVGSWDGETLIASWYDGGRDAVLRFSTVVDDLSVLAEDLPGPIGLSADGTRLAGTDPDATAGAPNSGEFTNACLNLRIIATGTTAGTDPRVDCDYSFLGRPQFDASGELLLVKSGVGSLDPVSGQGPFLVVGFAQDPDSPLPELMRVEAPGSAEAAAFLDPRRVVVLGGSGPELDDTRVHVCEVRVGCEQVAATEDRVGTAALGRQ